MHDVFRHFCLPQDFPFEVQGGRVDCAVVHEIDEDALTVTCRGGGGVGCLIVNLLREIPFMNFTGPDLFASLAVVAE